MDYNLFPLDPMENISNFNKKIIWNSKVFIHENAFENVGEMLFRSQCVK